MITLVAYLSILPYYLYHLTNDELLLTNCKYLNNFQCYSFIIVILLQITLDKYKFAGKKIWVSMYTC